MKIVIQRVLSASVSIAGEPQTATGPGLLLLVGVEKGDGETSAVAAASKIAHLRIFPVERGADDRMSRSILDIEGEILVVSQFTLAGSLDRGRRPSFDTAAPPEEAEPIYETLVGELRARGILVRTGTFGAMMEVTLVNDGPVTFVLDLGS